MFYFPAKDAERCLGGIKRNTAHLVAWIKHVLKQGSSWVHTAGPAAKDAWQCEIEARLRALESGQTGGVPAAHAPAPCATNPKYEQVKREGGPVTKVTSAAGTTRHIFVPRLFQEGWIRDPKTTGNVYIPTDYAIHEKLMTIGHRGTQITPKGIAKLIEMGILP
jgi:hypothetical protein